MICILNSTLGILSTGDLMTFLVYRKMYRDCGPHQFPIYWNGQYIPSRKNILATICIVSSYTYSESPQVILVKDHMKPVWKRQQKNAVIGHIVTPVKLSQ